MKRMLLAICVILIITNIGYCETFYPDRVCDNVKPNWVVFKKFTGNCISEVIVNGDNIIGKATNGRNGIVFVTRDVINSKFDWDMLYTNPKLSSRRECHWWNISRTDGIIVQYVLVYKGLLNDKYWTFCYYATGRSLYSKKNLGVVRDVYGTDGSPELLDDNPKLKLAIKKYLEINGYNSLDELFKAKGID